MVVKVHNGTRHGAENRCRTCALATVARGPSSSQEMIHCQLFGRCMPFDVLECSDYVHRGQTSLRDMYQTAWILETSEDRRQIGFVTYRKWRDRHRDEELVEHAPDIRGR